jgi:hypothetical protein
MLAAATLLAVSLMAADTAKPPMWDGNKRGMELVAIGHKKVTVYLADGRTTELGIPILIERPAHSAQNH